jgi:uncharacterized paraquat-inducible protein A
MWHAKAYTLAILVAVFSGVWPYTKLILMLCVWFLDGKKLSFRARERLLVVLDTLGKWSLLDAYMIVMFIVAFHIQIRLFDEAVRVNVIVNILSGFYVFLIATLLSLVCTHIIIYQHRKTRLPPLDA